MANRSLKEFSETLRERILAYFQCLDIAKRFSAEQDAQEDILDRVTMPFSRRAHEDHLLLRLESDALWF